MNHIDRDNQDDKRRKAQDELMAFASAVCWGMPLDTGKIKPCDIEGCRCGGENVIRIYADAMLN